MARSRIKRVIVIGAGFSAPAKIPIQNKIIEKMIEEPNYDILTGSIPRESVKFLNAYIKVGLFLLNNYGKGNYENLVKSYEQMNQRKQAIDIFLDSEYFSLDKTTRNGMEEIARSLKLDKDGYYAELYSYKEYIRSLIKNEGINVNLEDIFTSFDKSILSREHIHKYTYTQMDEIRFSIMRLFIYYFSKSVQEHSFKQEDYIHFFKFIKKQKTKSPTTIITTNWDTLIEEYCERNKIKYDYGFKIPYTNMHDNACESDIILLKIHGSANWLRCLHCGAFLVFKKGEAAKSLFEDGKNETCTVCGQGESFNAPSLQPEIITPTMLKSFANCLYLNIWSAASKALREATEVIFIGYSFPIADFDFRYMLQKSISTKARIDVVLHENDNPEQTESKNLQSLFPEKRYRDAFPKNTLRFFYNGFSDYFSCYSS